MNNATHTLQGMHDLLEDPKRWTQGELARDQYGRWCSPLNVDARCWCMIGAFRKVTGLPEAISIRMDQEPVFILLRESIKENTDLYFFADANDQTDHATVMKVIGTALERAREMDPTRSSETTPS